MNIIIYNTVLEIQIECETFETTIVTDTDLFLFLYIILLFYDNYF